MSDTGPLVLWFRPVTAKSQFLFSLVFNRPIFFLFVFFFSVYTFHDHLAILCSKEDGKMLDGVGLPVSDTSSRDKIDSSSLEHLIDVITSSHIIKDLPFGQKTL